MIAAILVITVGNAIGLILLTFAYFQTAALFDQSAQMLTAERDAACEESAKLKAALFPQLRTQNGAPAKVAPMSAEVQGKLAALFPPRVP